MISGGHNTIKLDMMHVLCSAAPVQFLEGKGSLPCSLTQEANLRQLNNYKRECIHDDERSDYYVDYCPFASFLPPSAGFRNPQTNATAIAI